jgi:hypothetical protein
MKLRVIAASLGLAIVVSAGYSYAETTQDTCGYDPVTGYWISPNGTVHQGSTFDHAVSCASQGKLPKIVEDRLGIYGDAKTKAIAANAVYVNNKVKEATKNDK